MPKAIIKQWYGSFSAAWAVASLPWYWALAIGAALAAPDAFAHDEAARHAGGRVTEAVPAPDGNPAGLPRKKEFAEPRRAAEAADEAKVP